MLGASFGCEPISVGFYNTRIKSFLQIKCLKNTLNSYGL